MPAAPRVPGPSRATWAPARRRNPTAVQTTRAAAGEPRTRSRSACRTLPRGSRRWRRPHASGPVPDLLDETLVALHAALDDDIDEPPQQTADITARQLPAALALLDEQHQLLEGQRGAGGVHAGDRSGMSGVDVAK